VCRLAEEIPSEVLVSVFIKTLELDEYVPFFEDQNITEHATPEKIAELTSLCG